MLSKNELDFMRQTVDSLLPDTCSILEATYVDDGQGSAVATWSVSQYHVPCRLDIKSGSQMLASGELKSYTEAMLTLSHDITVTTANRILHGGYTYTIQSVNIDQSWQAAKRLQLERI